MFDFAEIRRTQQVGHVSLRHLTCPSTELGVSVDHHRRKIVVKLDTLSRASSAPNSRASSTA